MSKRRKESSKTFHAMSWNILNIFICHMENILGCGKIFHDVVEYYHDLEYFATSHVWFVLGSTMDY
jgi:hypothetical protein